jgi:hypothetical protein
MWGGNEDMIRTLLPGVSFISVCVFSAATVRPQEWPVKEGTDIPESQVAVESLEIVDMPIKIVRVRAKQLAQRSAIEYSLTNTSEKEISTYRIMFFVFDATGALVDTENLQRREEIASQATKQKGFLLRRAWSAGDHAVLAIEATTSEEGSWRVGGDKLKLAAKARFSFEPYEPLQAEHKESLVLSVDDRREILKLALEDAIVQRHLENLGFWDKQREDPSRTKLDVYLLKKNMDPELLPRLKDVNFILLDEDRVQAQADELGSMVYLVFSKFAAEGSTVIVSLDIHLAQGRASGVQRIVGWGAGNTYEYRKEGVNWVGRAIGGWIV